MIIVQKEGSFLRHTLNINSFPLLTCIYLFNFIQ